MQINFNFDNSTNPSDTNSWANAPAGTEQQAQAAAAAVAKLYDTLYSNNVTINVTLQWSALPSNVGASNNGGGVSLLVPYSEVLAALQANENSPAQKLAFSTLPTTSPFGAGYLALKPAEAEALGIPNVSTLYSTQSGSSEPAAASLTINNTQSWNYNSLFNAIAHETSEIMGRNAKLGTVNYTGPESSLTNQPLYSVLDLFRYTASGNFDPTQGTTTKNSLAFFGYDNGKVLTNYTFNNGAVGGDLGDWAGLSFTDSYGAVSSNTGQVSSTDLTVMNLLGWNLANLSVAQLETVYSIDPAQNLSLSVVDSAAHVSQNFDQLETPALNGAISSITLTDGSPTLSLTVAEYNSGAQVFPLIKGHYAVSIADTSTDISQGFDSLEAAKNHSINSIEFTDSSPTLSLNLDQLYSDASVFQLISGHYALSVDLSSGTNSFQIFDLPNNVSHITLTGSGIANIGGNSSNDVFDIEAQGNHLIVAGGTGNYTIDSTAGTTTLDYSSVTGNLTVDLANGTVTKPGANNTTATDHVSGVQIFNGGSGTNVFEGAGTDDYTFHGNGTNNTLTYTFDPNGVTINLANRYSVSKSCHLFQ